MNKQNLIIQAAVAGLFSAATLSAFASGTGSAVGNTAQIATQAVTSTTDIGTGSIQYVQTGSVPAGNYYVYVKLNQGATFAEGSQSSVSTINPGALVINSATTTTGDSNVTVGAGVVSTDSTFIAFPITVNASLPANAETFTFKPVTVAPADGSVTGALAAASTGSLYATMSIGSSASFSKTTPVADEGTAASAPIAYFVSGITDGALSSGAAGFTAAPYHGTVESDVIDVVGHVNSTSGVELYNVSGSNTGNGYLLNLGAYYFKDVNSNSAGTGVTTPPFGADAATGFNIASNYNGGATSTAVVTGPAGFFSGATSVFVSGVKNCSSPLGLSLPAKVSTDGSTATFAAGSVPQIITGVPVFVCVQGNGTTAWTPGTPSITATMVSNTSTTANVTIASTPLYTLGTDGTTVYVREYVPAAATASTGYQSFLRVINTGTVAAKIGFAFIDDTLGTASTSATGTTTSAVPVGGAITLTSAQVEALVGTPEAASARPRVLVTAPSTITVQSYLYNSAANVFTEVSGGSNGGVGPAYPVVLQTGQ